MQLKLIKTTLRPSTEMRLTRMLKDTLLLRELSAAEIKAAYSELEAMRDALSNMLDKADGKNV